MSKRWSINDHVKARVEYLREEDEQILAVMERLCQWQANPHNHAVPALSPYFPRDFSEYDNGHHPGEPASGAGKYVGGWLLPGQVTVGERPEHILRDGQS